MGASPADRELLQNIAGTSYGAQFKNKVLDLAFIGGYEDENGNNWYYSPRKNDIGAWINTSGNKTSSMYRVHDVDGGMVGISNFVQIQNKWFGLGFNGSEQKMYWASRTYGGTGDGSILDQIHYSVSTFNTKYNPWAHGVDAINGAYRGTDRFGKPQSGLETATKATSAVVFLFGGAISDAIVGASVGEANIVASEATQLEFSYTKSAGNHLSDIVKRGENAGQLSRPYMNSGLTIREIMATGKGVADATFKGGMNYKVPGMFRGAMGTWELGINPSTNVIYHYNFVHP